MRMIRKTTALLMALLLMATSILPSMLISAAAASYVDSDVMLPAQSAYQFLSGSGTVTFNGQTVAVNTNGAAKVELQPLMIQNEFDLNTMNALLMTLNASKEFKMTITLSSSASGETAYSVLSSADGDFNKGFRVSDGYIAAGVYDDVALEIASLCASDLTTAQRKSMYISSIVLETKEAASIRLLELQASTVEAPADAISLLPSSASGWQQPQNMSSIVVNDQGAHVLTPIYGVSAGNGNATYIFSSPIKVSLFSELRFNFNVSNKVTIQLDLVGTDSNGQQHSSSLKLNSLFDNSVAINKPAGAGHYEGTFTMSQIVEHYKKYKTDSDAINTNSGANIDMNLYDIVDNGMITITQLRIYSVDYPTTMYDFAIVEPEVEQNKLNLMPSPDIAAEFGLSYDADGNLVATANKAASFEFPVRKFYNINELWYFQAIVTSTCGFDIRFMCEGIAKENNNAGATPDTICSKETRLSGDWNLHYGVSNNRQIEVKFQGSPNWAGLIPADGTYYVDYITIVLEEAGTVKLSAMNMGKSTAEGYVTELD
ncbi:MAG: hypothetical protein IKV35_05880, partial [Clostridia bacterium]|nr:hypothetical protein [Clostridia bacterium]